MEIRPILSALRHHKIGTVLVALQIAVSLAIVVNALFIVNKRIEKINRETGMDTENIIAISLRGAGDDYDVVGNIERDLAMLRGLPGVVNATAINQIPLSGSGSSTGVRSEPDKNITPTGTARYQFDQHGLDTLGANLSRGRNFYPEEIEYYIPGEMERATPATIIVTRDLADALYPDEDALGKPVYWGDMKSSTIVGIVDHMQGAWVSWEGLHRNLFHPGIQASASMRYLVRTAKGRRDDLMPVIEKQLAELNRKRVINYVRTHEDIIARTYELDRVMAGVLAIFVILLIGLTALVLVGLASWFVSQRTKQIGTRRALGARRIDILRYFLLENWLITTMGAGGGCLLTIALGYWLETSFELPRLDWKYLLFGVLVLWAVSQLAAFFPARKAASIPPAVATRTI